MTYTDCGEVDLHYTRSNVRAFNGKIVIFVAGKAQHVCDGLVNGVGFAGMRKTFLKRLSSWYDEVSLSRLRPLLLRVGEGTVGRESVAAAAHYASSP